MSAPLILLVEDDARARDGYAEFLELGGFRVTQTGTAEDALSSASEAVPDAVLTDIALPGLDGFGLASTLRKRDSTARVPILAMTAYWAADTHDRAERSGMVAMLLKPCQPEHLIAELRRAISRARPGALGSPAPAQ